jgi:hypothetical protein
MQSLNSLNSLNSRNSMQSLSTDEIYQSEPDDDDYEQAQNDDEEDDEGTASEGEGEAVIDKEEKSKSGTTKLDRDRARLTEVVARATASLDLISNARDMTKEDKAVIKEYAKFRGYDHRVRPSRLNCVFNFFLFKDPPGKRGEIRKWAEEHGFRRQLVVNRIQYERAKAAVVLTGVSTFYSNCWCSKLGVLNSPFNRQLITVAKENNQQQWKKSENTPKKLNRQSRKAPIKTRE